MTTNMENERQEEKQCVTLAEYDGIKCVGMNYYTSSGDILPFSEVELACRLENNPDGKFPDAMMVYNEEGEGVGHLDSRTANHLKCLHTLLSQGVVLKVCFVEDPNGSNYRYTGCPVLLKVLGALSEKLR